MSGIIKKWLYSLLFLAICIVLLVAVFPFLVERLILPPLLSRSGFADYTVSISRLGLTGCSLNVAGRPTISSPLISGELRIDWTPSGLLHQRIEKVSSNGLQINLAGLSSDKVPVQPKSSRDKNTGGSTSLPVIVDEVVVNNGGFLFVVGKRSMFLPINFSAKMLGDHDLDDPTGAVHFKIRLQAAEQVINATVALDYLQGRLTGKMDSNLDLARLASFSPAYDPDLITGSVQLEVEADMQMAPFALAKIEAGIVTDDLLISGKGFSIRTRDAQPARVKISGSGTTFDVEGEGFHVEDPLRSELDFDTHISLMQKSLQWQGTLGLDLETGQDLQGGALKDVQPIHISYEGSMGEKGGSTRFEIGQLEENRVGPFLIVQKKEISASLEKVSLDALVTYEKQPGVNAVSGSLIMIGHNATVELPQGVATLPKLALQADITTSAGQNERELDARFNVSDASFSMEKEQLELKGIQLAIPVAWPPPDEHFEKGSILVETIRLQSRKIGSFVAEVEQRKKTLKMGGFLQTALFPEDKVIFTGDVQLPQENNELARVSFSLPKGRFSVASFEDFLPALHGVSGGGSLDVHGELAISPCGLSGQADLAFADGKLSLNDAETELENIRFSLQFPDLPSLSSEPIQHLSIGAIRKNKIVVNDLNAWFEIESPRSLFIEKIAGRWSGGRVFTSAFRLQSGQGELELAIFCDRLELSSVLSQFSLAEAGGEGRLSGRVPVSYMQGKLFVDDGFLYSSPGEKGQLKIRQSKYLETAIPANVPHFSPLHFAGAALADFEYNWAKLHINSVEENLLLKLQVDGKPRQKLPFRFDPERNVFVRIDDKEKGGIDQPVKLDVNFNVPMNEMFRYKEKLMPLFRKFN